MTLVNGKGVVLVVIQARLHIHKQFKLIMYTFSFCTFHVHTGPRANPENYFLKNTCEQKKMYTWMAFSFRQHCCPQAYRSHDPSWRHIYVDLPKVCEPSYFGKRREKLCKLSCSSDSKSPPPVILENRGNKISFIKIPGYVQLLSVSQCHMNIVIDQSATWLCAQC